MERFTIKNKNKSTLSQLSLTINPAREMTGTLDRRTYPRYEIRRDVTCHAGAAGICSDAFLQASMILPSFHFGIVYITYHPRDLMAGSSPLPVSLRSKLSKASSHSRLKSFSATLSLLQNIVFFFFLLRYARQTFYFLRGHGPIGSIALLYRRAYARLNALFLTLPGVSSQVDKQVAAAVRDIAGKIAPDEPEATRYLTIPKHGWEKEKLLEELLRLSGLPRTRWEDGKVSGAVYHGEDSLLDVQAQAMKLWSVANPIHPDVFPAVRKMEAEIVKMVGDLFHAPKDEGCGVTTSGGTESILMGVLAARRKGEIERGITEPEMIIPSTAHPAFQKAAAYFKIKLHQVACPAPSYKASIPAMARLINSNTVLLVGSMPEYAHGIVDDIPALSKLALRHKIPLHVDCCLGSFLLPFLSRSGFPSPYAEQGGFDFQQPGVTSISVDTHKYGFAPKGNSVVLYRTQQMRRYQYFISPDWAGGVYASPSIAGSRPGALIAGCWASLMAIGEDGYMDACHRIITTRQTIQNAITEHPVLSSCLKVLGEPMVSVVAFDSVDPAIDIYDIADAMGKKGWHLNAGQKPPMIHVAVTIPMTKAEAVDSLVNDLVGCVEAEKEAAVERMRAGGLVDRKKGDAAALYGVAGKVAGGALVGRLVEGYMDTLYKA